MNRILSLIDEIKLYELFWIFVKSCNDLFSVRDFAFFGFELSISLK